MSQIHRFGASCLSVLNSKAIYFDQVSTFIRIKSVTVVLISVSASCRVFAVDLESSPFTRVTRAGDEHGELYAKNEEESVKKNFSPL